ncbi:MAG: polyprenyl synthetase family protein [Desulfobacterales bacterium]|jgi:geranylgeranyl diphosphate synthase type II
MESPPLFDLKAYLQSKQQQVNDWLVRSLPPASSSRIADAMGYSVMAGGKRLRPVLCLAATEAVGGRTEDALNTAVALELIHTYSLIHDDLPSMDDDVLRRGKPTCHVAFDEATAILSGDALLTLAFQLLASPNGTTGVPADRRLQVIHAVAAAAGYEGMIGGQMADIAAEGNRIALSRLEQLHLMKTGALINAAITTGAILGGGTAEQIRHLEEYAQNIGLAFQIIDDILNVEGDPALLGKAIGTDREKKKSTYPVLLGLVESRKLAADRVKEALQALEYFDKKADPLRAVAQYVINRKR